MHVYGAGTAVPVCRPASDADVPLSTSGGVEVADRLRILDRQGLAAQLRIVAAALSVDCVDADRLRTRLSRNDGCVKAVVIASAGVGGSNVRPIAIRLDGVALVADVDVNIEALAGRILI